MNKLKVFVYTCPGIGRQLQYCGVYFGLRARCYVVWRMLSGLPKGTFLSIERKGEDPRNTGFKGD